ncbi:NADH-quinone oxidoreductase subunit NuoF [Candidatus Bipolaricaulota bacterium]|nr:NADH-quinone oxidoreductase subunit NuoF [Candidatus Bipolaricaulota bacterium]MBS3814081.1 NADH-quinone oxidoreductase subunit NuoF [Candidatus Bipolaricaulota bacterium]MBS3825446.1 NADH-quinone oxidoreductase subunit NuoF [Candidatus Bipolaricaulota bacterium]
MKDDVEIRVGYASCGIAAGAKEVYEKLEGEVRSRNLPVKLKKVGCVGMCHNEPLLEVEHPNGETVTYGNLEAGDVENILKCHLSEDRQFDEKLIPGRDDYDYFAKQKKIVLKNSGIIDPEEIDEYLERDGYSGLEDALEMEGAEIIDLVKESNLRGRGGAGFPTGIKWGFARGSEGDEKYIICNADEGDPGAFMDRSIIEGDPHALLEGMVIAAYAIGAKKGYIYCRAEYPLALERLDVAIDQARENGFLGEDILGTSFSFDIEISKGAGAFVCGEETALMKSIEGERGMPTSRPPYPAQSGLFGQPTNINNVETYANVPWIIRNGPKKYHEIGTEKSGGTKVFALAGKIKRGGLVEVPIGTSLEEIIFEVGGGIEEDRGFKAVQLGGPSGGCLPEEQLDTPVDYETLTEAGAIMGSGGMIVMDEGDCMVDVAKYFLDFTQEESCGKCTFCRVGTKRMLEILERISGGDGEEEDIEKLRELAPKIKNYSLCGLGQTAPNPVLTTLRYFEDEYLEHIENQNCPAAVCRDLITFNITQDCIGCTTCSQECPVDAIDGESGSKHEINQDTCIKCGTCREVCPVDAVEVV